MSNFIRTFTGRHITPTAPRSEDICIEDIAHALSQLCRANGHFKAFFSVAQHSVNCCLEAEARDYSQEVRLACLLHDAGEAYLSDVTRPVKVLLPDYSKYEDVLLHMIWDKFLPRPLAPDEAKLVFEVDDCMLYYEFRHFMDERLFDRAPRRHGVQDFSEKPMAEVEQQFLKLFAELREIGMPEKSK